MTTEVNLGSGQRNMKSNTQRCLGHLQRLGGALCALTVAFLPVRATSAGFASSFKARNIEIPVFLGNSVEPVAVWKIDNVFTDHRRIGFFRVKLLPILVAEKIRLEFTSAKPQTNWLEEFRFKLAPTASRNAIEWRDFSISFPEERMPRLKANRGHLAVNAGEAVCRLDGVTVQVGSEQMKVAHAELRTRAQSAEVAWQALGKTIQWDLFTGQCTTNSVKQEIQNEEP